MVLLSCRKTQKRLVINQSINQLVNLFRSVGTRTLYTYYNSEQDSKVETALTAALDKPTNYELLTVT